MRKALPHDPYATAVMDALASEALLDHAGSWTEYASDNGIVMLMEVVISLDGDRARAADWDHGVTLLWNQIEGWTWGPGDRDGRLQYVKPLVDSSLVPDPADVVRAAEILLTDETTDRLPVTGTTRPAPATIPPQIQELLDEVADEQGEEDVPTEETLRALAAYTGG
ncbi:hypothetical protein [Streptomyces sp. S1]|uniref:hypothetical protein n=1 Tax=Streptomyces sp. S1 TaxID=718288 RepID=UPI003D73D0DC